MISPKNATRYKRMKGDLDSNELSDMMTMEAQLQKAFNAYLDLARARLRPQQPKPSKLLPFELVRNKSIELRNLVDELESLSEFHEVVNHTLVSFPRQVPEPNRADLGADSKAFVLSRSIELQNFFRRSQCYGSIYYGGRVDSDTPHRF